MSLPTAYLTSQKNLDGILAAIQAAKAPPKFTQQFLQDLGFKSTSDRLVINVMKGLGFLSGDGVPTQRYFEYLDQTQAPRVMAEGVMDAYADLFAVNTKAQNMSRADLKNKMKTLSQGKLTDGVLDKLAMTFLALSKHADFDAADAAAADGGDTGEGQDGGQGGGNDRGDDEGTGTENDGGGPGSLLTVDGLIYNIQIQLPESRDPKVYDALFQSLKKHLGR
ncbi:MAG TPA: DUF5343 domain-containing protein [Solirubrobacterales bacterium]|jgi:hypothetical protein|nr:DUF5343 domain-containing protein [Solirubrobacterales bacterium]